MVRLGGRLAQAAQADVTLLHIASPVPSMYTGLDGIEETLAELLQTDTPLARHLRWCAKKLASYGITADIKLRHGVVASEILREAQIGDYDMIVIGSRTLASRLGELVLDNVARQILKQTECPVLVV
jgi:nucleotide-binding universal stress UspA family protein